MADVTGTLRQEHDGKTYALRLTPLGIAALQDAYGNDFLSQLEKVANEGGLPNLRLFVDIVARALEKGEGMAATEATQIADDMVAQDMTLPIRIIQASFPAPEGNVEARPGR